MTELKAITNYLAINEREKIEQKTKSHKIIWVT